MRYGFVIDQNRCIGCHACTVACKEEHNIALGVNRTWVKYIEKGRYPDTRRHFAVLRCNHCDDAPCIEICPTVALFRRPDGIVDFDNERCIGCKSCMQACPYDALYIDPERNTAAKCNFDASRVEMGYKPACEVVCPTQAILSGDLDDPNSSISKRIAMEKVSVRKAEKGTKPKLFYVGVDGDLLNPTMMEPQATHFWAEKDPGEDLYALKSANLNRPIPGAAREVYDVPHATPWGKMIASYLWTKVDLRRRAAVVRFVSKHGIRAGRRAAQRDQPGVVAAVSRRDDGVVGFRSQKARPVFLFADQAESKFMAGIGRLCADDFWHFVGVLAGSDLHAGESIAVGHLAGGALCRLRPPAIPRFFSRRRAGGIFGKARCCFGTCSSRPSLAGAAMLILIGSLELVTPYRFMSPLMFAWLINILVISLFASLAMIFSELFMKHGAEDAVRAGELLLRGPLSKSFWLFVVGLGVVVPIGLIFGRSDR